MTKELEIELNPSPPKLAVTATLDGGNGVFFVSIKESLSLVEYNIRTSTKKNIRDGEIRLFEDEVLMRSIPGPFDMSTSLSQSGEGWTLGRNGFQRVSFGFDTQPGSVYRLEVDVEGYPMAVASSVMPEAPVASTGMDTSVQVIRKNVKEIGSVGYWLSNMGNWWETFPERYWPVSVNVGKPGGNNYISLEILKYHNYWEYFWGIGGSDASILLESGMDSKLLNSEQADLYMFSMLMASDFKGTTRNFYAAIDESTYHQENDDSYLDDHPDFEKITTRHSLVLRVRNITPATYRYFRSLSLQLTNDMFTEQPTTVVGNIEGGHGIFSVYNTVRIPLLEWETYEYRKKTE